MVHMVMHALCLSTWEGRCEFEASELPGNQGYRERDLVSKHKTKQI